MIRVLIADDSQFLRFNLQKLLSKYDDIEIVDSVKSGEEVLLVIEKKPVDVLILDLFMPKMDGLETLKKVNLSNPIPTIILTSANQKEHSELYFKALQLGAIEVIEKPSGLNQIYIEEIDKLIINAIRNAAISSDKLKVLVNNLVLSQQDFEKNKNIGNPSDIIDQEQDIEKFCPPFYLIIVGASTGGPGFLFEFVKSLRYCEKVSFIIIQHMPPGFTTYFSERLHSVSEYKICEIKNAQTLKAGHGYVVPGDYHLKTIIKDNDIIMILNQEEKIWGVRPSIDYTMINIAPVFKDKAIGIILTGMGQDGAYGISKIRDYGGYTFAQDPNEALINSMPLHAIQNGSINEVLELRNIVLRINEMLIKGGC